MSDVRIFILDTEIAELRLSHKGEFSLSRKTSSFIGISFQQQHPPDNTLFAETQPAEIDARRQSPAIE